MLSNYLTTTTTSTSITQDPLSHRMIEKRRRDRMNNCLTDLSRLIPNSFIKKVCKHCNCCFVLKQLTVELNKDLLTNTTFFSTFAVLLTAEPRSH